MIHTTAPRTALSRLGILAFGAVIMFAVLAPARADDLGGLIEKLGKTLEKARGADGRSLDLMKDSDVKQFLDALGELARKKTALGLLKSSFSFGYTGDRGFSRDDPRDTSHLLNVETSFLKDLYPTAVRFKASTKLALTRSQLQNEMSTILLSVNYYLFPFLETYAFTEKFSDSFMNIKQRYETGFGIKFEHAFDPLHDDSGTDEAGVLAAMAGAPSTEASRVLRRAKDKVEKQFMIQLMSLKERFVRAIRNARLLPEDLNAVYVFMEAFEKEHGRIDTALSKNRSWLTVGIALTLFSEVEQAEMNPYLVNTAGQKEYKSYLLDAQQRLRYVVRPSFEWIISRDLTLASQFYFKFPLGRAFTGKVIPDPEQPEVKAKYADWRLDILSSLKLNLVRDPGWGGDVSLAFEHQYHYDNLPPSLPERLGGVTFAGLGFKNTVAANSHHFYMLKLIIGF